MQPDERVPAELSAEQRSRVDALLDELLDLPEERRGAALDAHGLDDSAVAGEVESLLRAARASADFMSSPARPYVEEMKHDEVIGLRLGAWRVRRLIGRGGMGEVYEATRADGDFEQRVAVKLLQKEAAAQLERFQIERQILARLKHSGIARLYDGGIVNDRPFMVMEYVDGRAITDYCAAIDATLAQRCALFDQVCEAVAYAHRNLIVHRDLKPSNILVTDDGTVKLLDFGVAKLLDGQRSRVTQAIAPMTPICAAPEQLTGEPITTATDVYALGLLLFELLTGTNPWMGIDTPALHALRTVLQGTAPLASVTAQGRAHSPVPAHALRGDLDAIIAKALRQEPALRYVTVESMQLDLRRFQQGAPVVAREGARLYVVGRILRRYRWIAAAIAAVIVSLSVGLGLAAWQAQRAAVERDIARRDAAREEAVRYNLTKMFRSALADQGAQDKQPATAKGMIDSSAQRVLREYHDEPQLAGQIVLALADLYGALEDVNGAGSLLEGFIAEANPSADPAALADARQKLANIELLRGRVDRAETLLDQAQEFWAHAPRAYPEERLEGLTVRARLLRARGDLDGSIKATREAITQRITLSGHDHRETAILYNALAITLSTANRLDEALAAFHETSGIYRAIGLADGLDAQIILANTGNLELRIGHLQEAETLLKTAVERERSLAGDSAAVAAAMGYYGRVLSITNRAPLAVGVLHEASDLANRYAGPASPVAILDRLYLGEAEATSGDAKAAALTLSAAHDTALAQYGAGHLLVLRTQLALAQLAADRGEYDHALAELSAATGALRKLGAQSETTLAQALEATGSACLSAGRSADAVAPLREAVGIREKSPEDLWELAQARERLGEALAPSGGGALELLQNAARDLESQLGASHPATLRAKQAVARSLDLSHR